MTDARVLFTPMTVDDAPAINELEPRCFSAPWSTESYLRELRLNPRAFYWVVRPDPAAVARESPVELPPVLAYGGYWLLGDEVHIMTIATHPDFVRRGLGEWLLRKMIERACIAGAVSITLEVRLSNEPAQRLYGKWGFRQVGRRKRYYRDNGEDALIFTLDGLDRAEVLQPLVEDVSDDALTLGISASEIKPGAAVGTSYRG